VHLGGHGALLCSCGGVGGEMEAVG
jgi:hypothetical protein